MEGEFVEMGKLIGAGLACTGMGGAAVGKDYSKFK